MKKINFTNYNLKTTLLAILTSLGTFSFGQSGWLDDTFGNGGIVITNATGMNSGGFKIAEQPDGKILILGNSDDGSVAELRLYRHLPDGSLDLSFGTTGVITQSISFSNISLDIVIQTDGKILVLTTQDIYRYNVDGTLDITFDGDGVLNCPANYKAMSIGLQSNGNIAVGYRYYFSDFMSSTLKVATGIYNSDGSQLSLTQSPSLDSYFTSIDKLILLVQDDAKIIICGHGDFGPGYVFRVNADGSADNTYGISGNGLCTFGQRIRVADLQSDGKLVFISANSDAFYRITTDGNLEYVGPVGIYTYWATDLHVLADDKILFSASSSPSAFNIYKRNNDGTIDNNFSSDGKITINISGATDDARAIAIQSDGKILVTGSANGNFGTIRIDQCIPKTSIDVIHVCDAPSYTWIDGNTYTSSNNTATHTLFEGASNGCDSVITLNLTISNSNTGTDIQTACDSYTWIDGNTYAADNTSAQFTLTNMSGCDSVVTLNLTIASSPIAGAVNNGDGTLSATGTGTYQWIDCGTNTAVAGATSATFIPTANGNFSVVVTSGSCDDTSACVNYNSVGLAENNNSVFTAYPNPTTGLITINSNNAIIAKIVVRDAAGRLIYENSNTTSSSAIDLTEMENGIYFITIFDANQSQTIMKVLKK